MKRYLIKVDGDYSNDSSHEATRFCIYAENLEELCKKLDKCRPQNNCTIMAYEEVSETENLLNNLQQKIKNLEEEKRILNNNFFILSQQLEQKQEDSEMNNRK